MKIRLLTVLALFALLIGSATAQTPIDREAFAKSLQAVSDVKHPEMKATVTVEGTRLIVHSPVATKAQFDQQSSFSGWSQWLTALRSQGFTEYVYTNDADLKIVVSTTTVVPVEDDRIIDTSWTKEVKTNPFRGTAFMQFTLDGTFLTTPRTTTRHNPTLIVHCLPGDHRLTKGKFIEGYIVTGSVLENTAISGDVTSIRVQYRLDDGKIQLDFWDRSTDFSAVFFRGSDFANLLYGHKSHHKENTSLQVRKIVIEVSEFVGGNIVIQFDLPDSIEVAESCGIIQHK